VTWNNYPATLQVRALPGANQVLEPFYWRFRLSKIGAKKCSLANVLPIFAFTIRRFIALFLLSLANA
jgi:hypothetical protein